MTNQEIASALAELSRKQASLFEMLVTSMNTAEQAAPTQTNNLWTLPNEARLTTSQLAVALDRSTSYIHKAIDAKRTPNPLPYRRAGNRLLFVAGEVRPWLTKQELVMRTPVRAPLRRGATS